MLGYSSFDAYPASGILSVRAEKKGENDSCMQEIFKYTITESPASQTSNEANLLAPPSLLLQGPA